MVKSVVKPLKMIFLRERIVPKKSVFIRAFGVFCFGIPWGRCPAPKARALPTALHPEVCKILIFFGFSVSGQTCGQTVIFEEITRKYIAKKVSVCKAFRRFSKSNDNGAVSCSQSTRATNCATSRNYLIFICSCPLRFLLQLRLCRRFACQSPSCCHSLLLALSPAGRARKRPQLRYIPMVFEFKFA